MKFLMEVGTQLDLNVAYNGGAADAGLIYAVPEDNGFITVNISTGVVDAVAEGESVVWVYSGTPSVLVATVVIEVASAATYAERLAIRDGDNEVVVAASSVAQGPALLLITGGTAFTTGPSSYATHPNGANAAFDGNDATYFQSWESGASVVNTYIGKYFSTVKQIKRIKIKWLNSPNAVYVKTSFDLSAWDTTYTIQVQGDEQTIDLPAYTPGIGIMLQPVNANGSGAGGYIDRWQIKEIELYE